MYFETAYILVCCCCCCFLADAGTKYGSKLHVFDWSTRKLRQTIDLGQDGMIPLEIRFAHEPTATYGFVVRGKGT